MSNQNIDLEYFKTKLTDYKEKLISELKTVGRINPENPNDWEAVPENTEDSADPNDQADSIESYEENTATLNQLEQELFEVNEALVRIENGKYGICEVSGEEIEKERLEANPAARTCKAHI